ncbi:hypothetical protein B0A49_00787 [Cryomyces minteri]|uniref:DUF7708 domain-containing protein n=1 Tax=Cryomyces minteri TaxID=331657 RepID=A0A4U0XMF9_9PEZI|nr:hypothetical protein B0A49_00787 [Cryomyces minteri]
MSSSTAPSLFDAQDIYNRAVARFNDELTKDESKRKWLRGKNTIQDVQAAVLEAQSRYQAKSEQSKIRTWLASLSARLMHYAAVMDVFAQIHPEYAALAWGTIKFLFIIVLNQEELISQLSKALSRIGNVLARVEIKSALYPTDEMKRVVEDLYAHLIKFFQRTLRWYEDGKLKHMWTAVCNPYPLRFKDLVEELDERARDINRLAASLAQVELREMHRLIQVLITNQTVQSSLLVDTNRVCPSAIAGLYATDDGRSSPQTSTIFGEHQLCKHGIKDIATDMVDLISSESFPVVWALNANLVSTRDEERPIEVLKYLVVQVLELNKETVAQSLNPGFNAARVQSARTEEDWFKVLKLALSGLPRVYVIIDTEIFGQSSSASTWSIEFYSLLEDF